MYPKGCLRGFGIESIGVLGAGWDRSVYHGSEYWCSVLSIGELRGRIPYPILPLPGPSWWLECILIGSFALWHHGETKGAGIAAPSAESHHGISNRGWTGMEIWNAASE